MLDRSDILAQMGRYRITLEELSRRTGLSRQSIGKFLRGGDIKLTSLCAIVRALDGEVRLCFDQNE